MTPADVLRDLRRNWMNCFVFIQAPDSSTTELFQIIHISENEPAQITLQSKRYGSLIINLGSDYRILFKSPITGVFQSGREAFLVTKRFGDGGARYSRGINAGNTSFTNVLCRFYISEEAGLLGIPDNKLEQTILDMFNQGHTNSIRTAIELLVHGDFLSVAIDRSFAVSHSLYNPSGFTVFYRTTPVGDVSEDCKLVDCKEKVFAPSIKRLLSVYN